MDTSVRIALMTTILSNSVPVINVLKFMTGKNELDAWSEPVDISTPLSDLVGLLATMIMSTESLCIRGLDSMWEHQQMVYLPRKNRHGSDNRPEQRCGKK
jgi:hypothetical protein